MPNRSDSRIRCDIDFDKAGKQISFLAVPSSTNESAYGTVTIPIAVISHGSGPTIFLSGGVHGDEYEGPVALMNLVRELEPAQVKGRIIVIPCLNLPAVLAGQRCSPVDGLNLNRVFPGERDGTITPMIAHYVCHQLLPMIDIQVDLHSGGKTLEYIPSINMRACEDTVRRQQTFDAIKAFGAPMTLVDRNLDDTGILNTVFEQHGIMNFDTELGGAGRVDRDTVALAGIGVCNVLKHFHIMAGDTIDPEQQGRPPSRYAQVTDLDSYVMAPDDGLYETFVDLGETVDKGQLIGQVHYPDNLNRPVSTVEAPASGFVICKRPLGQVQRGDNIAIIGQDLDKRGLGLN